MQRAVAEAVLLLGREAAAAVAVITNYVYIITTLRSG
jgi:hypothetical protein